MGHWVNRFVAEWIAASIEALNIDREKLVSRRSQVIWQRCDRPILRENLFRLGLLYVVFWWWLHLSLIYWAAAFVADTAQVHDTDKYDAVTVTPHFPPRPPLQGIRLKPSGRFPSDLWLHPMAHWQMECQLLTWLAKLGCWCNDATVTFLRFSCTTWCDCLVCPLWLREGSYAVGKVRCRDASQRQCV